MIKKLAILFYAVILSTGLLFAQEETSFVVNEIEGVMSQGKQTGLEIFIPEVQKKEVEAALSKWTKSNKGKYVSSKKSSEIFQDNVQVSSVSDNTVDMYTILTQENEGVRLRTFVDLGGTFLSSSGHPQAFEAMERVLIDFSRNQLISSVDKNIKTEEKHLSQLQSQLKSLEKQKTGYEKDIVNHQNNIQKQELAMTKNETDQKTKEQQIAIQQEILLAARQKQSAMGSSLDESAKKLLANQVKTEEKTLKTFESQLKSLRSSYAASAKDIEKSKSTIAQREQDIIKNTEDQNTKQQQIELQKQIVEAIKQKRSEIK